MSIQTKKRNPFIRTTVSQDDPKPVEQQSGVSEVNDGKSTEGEAQVDNRQNMPDAGDYAYSRGIVHATDSYVPATMIPESGEPDYATEALLKQAHIAKRNGGGELTTNKELNDAVSVPPSAFFQPPRRREPFATTKGETASDRFWNDNKRRYNYPDSDKEVKEDVNTAPETSSNSNTEDGDGDYEYWDDVLDFLDTRRANIKLPSKEEMEKELRRQRTKRIIAGIGDTLSAIINVIGTTKYAPNAYDPTNSMSEKMKERYEKMKEDWKADEERAYNYAMMAAKIRQDIMDRKRQDARDKIADDRAVRKEEVEAMKAQAYLEYQEKRMQGIDAEIAYKEYLTKIKQIEAGKKPQLIDSQISKNNTAATKNVAQAKKTSTSGSGKGGGKKGSSKSSSGSKDYVKETTSTTTDAYGRTKTTKKTERKTSGSGGSSKGSGKIGW